MRHLEFPNDVQMDCKATYYGEIEIKDEEFEIKDEEIEEFDIKDDILLPLHVSLESVVNFQNFDQKNLINEQNITGNNSCFTIADFF